MRPIFSSERLLAGFANQPPFLFCGGSSDTIATALATDNEALAPDGWPMDRAERTELLKRGWRAFTRVADSNGIPDRDDMIRIHRAMFPSLPDPIPVATRDRKQVRDDLDAGNALSIALRLSALPAASKWRQYTSADHQAVIWDRDNATVRRMDPMHAHSNTYRGERLVLDQGLDAAEAIEDGLILYWLYPIGGWTRERLRTQELRQDKRALVLEVAAKDKRIARLKAELEACQDGTPQPGPTPESVWERSHVEAIAFHEQKRVEGP